MYMSLTILCGDTTLHCLSDVWRKGVCLVHAQDTDMRVQTSWAMQYLLPVCLARLNFPLTGIPVLQPSGLSPWLLARQISSRLPPQTVRVAQPTCLPQHVPPASTQTPSQRESSLPDSILWMPSEIEGAWGQSWQQRPCNHLCIHMFAWQKPTLQILQPLAEHLPHVQRAEPG